MPELLVAGTLVFTGFFMRLCARQQQNAACPQGKCNRSLGRLFADCLQMFASVTKISLPQLLKSGKMLKMLTLQDLKSLTWESLPPNGPEWTWVILNAKEAWEEIKGKALTPQEVFDLEFDKAAQEEILKQE
jgi:hypothetical protein